MPNLVGSAPNQISTNGDLGGMAFQDPEAVVIKPQSGANPASIGSMVFELVSNTTLVVKVKGSDGVIRSATLTLA